MLIVYQLLSCTFLRSDENRKESKLSVIQQKINGYRKKNKLDIPAVQIEEIESWLNNID